MSETKPKGMSALSKTYLTIIAILIIAIVVLYVSNRFNVRGADKHMEAMQGEWSGMTHRALVDQAHEMLRLSAVPLAWAVRSEMMDGTPTTRVDDYLQRFVKEPDIKRVALVIDGSIEVATDKKLEEQDAAQVFPMEALDVDSAAVIDDGSGEIFLAVPVVSLDARLGTLIVVYSRESIDSRFPAPTRQEP
jgi:hypothetical protein